MSGHIYLITCLVNQKKYIGQTIHEVSRRYTNHWSDSKYSDTVLYRAFKKYGRENFAVEEICTAERDHLNALEAYYAEQYETYVWDNNPGYNSKICGEGGTKGYKASEETCKKLADAQRGRKASDETRRKMSEAKKGVPRNNGLLGTKRKPYNYKL